VSATSRSLALAAYLLSLPGALAVLLLRRGDRFVAYHARQSLMIAAAAVAAPLLWAAVAWLLAWVPMVGPMVAVVLFNLVLAAYAWLAAAWVAGIVYALRGQRKSLPVLSRRVRLVAERPNSAVEAAAERAERTQASDA
jgi:uncharacterized membrane protein